MEIILKRSKITNSILKQSLRSTEIDLNVGEILGGVYLIKQSILFVIGAM